MNYKLGFTACYINDHQFSHLMNIPKEAAVKIVQEFCPDTIMGGNLTAKDLTCDGNNDTDAACNGWLNKLFVIIGFEHDRWLAINNHDGKFSIYAKKQ